MEKDNNFSFNSVQELRAAQARKQNFQPANLYPRDGTKDLDRLERRIAGYIDVNPDNLLLFNSGMLAVTEAIELASPSQGSTILYGEQLYSQTTAFITNDLKERGVKPIQVDASFGPGIQRVVTRFTPDIIFFETVANGPDMQVLDLEALLTSDLSYNPLIILDNTLPTSVTWSLDFSKRPDKRIIVVESGTKFYAQNKQLCGLAYTSNPELLQRLMERRRRRGSLLAATATINQHLPPTKDEFTSRIKKIANNAQYIAASLSEALDNNDFFVSYPDSQIGQGISPVLFLTSPHIDQFKVTERLWEQEVVRRYCDLGQSFGFDRTRLWPDSSYPTIRIAGGMENQEGLEQLSSALKEVLQDL